MKIKINTKISPKMVLQAENQKAILFFFFIKSKFSHSIIYNYNPTKLARLSGISPNTIRRYIRDLKKKRYLSITNKHLHLKSTKKIADGDRLIKVESKPWTTWRQFENRVYAQLIKLNLLQQEYHYRMKGGFYGNRKKVKLSVLKNYHKQHGKYREESVNSPHSSVRQLSKYFGKSTYWVSEKLKLLRAMGYIKTKQHIIRMPNICPPDYLEQYAWVSDNGKYLLVHYGQIIRVRY